MCCCRDRTFKSGFGSRELPANQKPLKNRLHTWHILSLRLCAQTCLRTFSQALSSLTTTVLCSSTATMRPVPSSAGPALRSWTRHTLPSATTPSRLSSANPSDNPIAANASQRRHQTNPVQAASTTSFDTPFKDPRGTVDVNKIPSFKSYRSSSAQVTNRVFQYFMVGSMGLLTAAGAKATVQGTQPPPRNSLKL